VAGAANTPAQSPRAQRLERSRMTAALRDAAITAAIAFGLFLPLIGFETITDIRNETALATRWPLLVALTAIIGLGRLCYSLAL